MKRAIQDWEKKDVMEKILHIWKKNPHLRLGQLLTNACPNLFYAEDYEVIENLHKHSRDHGR